MSQSIKPNLKPGKTYRTRDLRCFSANPARLAKRLVREGKLIQTAHGIFYVPVKSRFGQAPPRDEEILRGFLGSNSFVITGPPKWNALGLGSTALFAATLAYNKKRTGEFKFDDRRFLLRRVYFPSNPSPEWFLVDLLQHHEMAGIAIADLRDRLVATLREGRWDHGRLRAMAQQYGTKSTLGVVEQCLINASDSP